ncbi:MAG: hypothetical protein AB7F88_07195 [Pyrinomonadaceae bacterium]
MTETNPILDADEPDTKPRKSRQPKADRRVFVYRVADGKPKEQGSFPEAVIGDPLERRLPTFLKEMFGHGDYRVETRKPNGHFEKSFEFSIADTEPERERIVDVEPEDFEAENILDGDDFGQMNSVEVENLLLKERLKRLEEDISRQKSGTQTETQTLISALEESRREQRELMMMMIAQSQKPQQDATTQAMNILEKSLGIVTKAKAISEEIAPQESQSNGSFIGDAARLIDSLGKNAGTFAPFVMSALGGTKAATATATRPTQAVSAGELANLAEKIQKRNVEKEGAAKK